MPGRSGSFWTGRELPGQVGELPDQACEVPEQDILHAHRGESLHPSTGIANARQQIVWLGCDAQSGRNNLNAWGLIR
jgi:hypothetical protein